MTIVVTVKVTDGIVLAADSAASFFGVGGTAVKIYNNANKIFNLVKDHPVGSMVYGSGSIGSSSIETLSKDLRTRFANTNIVSDPLYIDSTSYTIRSIADKARLFF